MNEASNHISYKSPIIAMKRYGKVEVVKVVGLTKINEFLESIQYNNWLNLQKEFNINIQKGNGIELITINNLLDPNGEIVCLATVGILNFVSIDKLTQDSYSR